MGNCNRKTLSAQAVEEMMEQHKGLIHAFIQRQGGGSISYEEALQAGRIGLWQAIRGYDRRRGTAFSTYAWVAICNQIRRRVRELHRERRSWWGEVPQPWQAPDPELWLEGQLIRKSVHELVRQLPERLQRVIIGRYGLGDEPPCTLKELGGELGMSGERVRQLQQEALAWLRHPTRSVGLRQLLGRNRAADYRRALAKNAALRRKRRGKR